MSVLTLSSPSGDESKFFSSCSGVGSASPHISFPKTYMKNTAQDNEQTCNMTDRVGRNNKEKKWE